MAENVAFNNTIEYFDLNYLGVTEEVPPSKFSLRGVSAIKNALKLFVISSAGDYYHSNLLEGSLPRILGRPLNANYAAEIQSWLESSIKKYFSFNLVTYEVFVSTNLKDRRYEIVINITDLVSKQADKAFIGVTPF